jgi:hypothetical protein
MNKTFLLVAAGIALIVLMGFMLFLLSSSISVLLDSLGLSSFGDAIIWGMGLAVAIIVLLYILQKVRS